LGELHLLRNVHERRAGKLSRLPLAKSCRIASCALRLAGMFWPGSDVANIGPDYIYGVDACGGLPPGVAHLAIDHMEDAIHPTGDQITSLAQLKSAVQASEIFATSCASAVPITPVGRLDVVAKRVDAMIKAAEIVGTPLDNFYDTLTNEQRHHLAGALGADLLIGRQERSPHHSPRRDCYSRRTNVVEGSVTK
jgi:hypothetical protein